ncbi:MAG: PQQ-binding-like beta-propeller repeat protein [Dokdonella sp.]
MTTKTVRAEPTPLWSVNFDSVGTVPQKADSRPELASGGMGSGLFLSIPPGGISRVASIAKIDGSGTLVWLGQHTSNSSFYGTPPKARVLSDGSVIVIADAVYRYSASGQLLWAAPVPSSIGSDVVEVGGRLFLASSTFGRPATVIDLASGRTLEALSDASVGLGQDAALAAVGSDTVYVFNAQGMWIYKFRLDPLRIEWSVSLAGITSPLETTLQCCSSSIFADESGAYVSGYSVVAKVSPADGSLLWSQPTVPDYGLTLAADSSSPFVILAVGSNVVASVSRSTGVRRWTHLPPAAISAFQSFDGSVAVVGNPDANASGPTAAFFERIRRDDGTVLWQQPIIGSATTAFSVYGVGVDGDRIAASGVQCTSEQVPELCELMIWHVSVDGGAVAMTKPVFPQSVEYARSAGDGVSTAAAALVATPTGPQILVRRIRDSDGVVLWETSTPASLPNAPGRAIQELNIVLTKSASSDVVVAFSRRPDGYVLLRPLGDAVVAKFNGSDGSLQWRRSLLDRSDGFTETAASAFSLDTDTAGNVFASVQELRSHASIPLYENDRREVRKYASATGDELLRVVFLPMHRLSGQFLPAPVQFQIVGDVLVAGEPPMPRKDFGVFGIDATTGSVLWNSFPSYLRQPYLAEGSSGFSTLWQSAPSPLLRLSRFDANTGNIAWESTYAHPFDSVYTQPVMSRGSDNGVYVGTSSRLSDNAPASQNPYNSRVLRVDDASGSITWVNRFENGPVPPYGLARPLFGHDGVLVTVQYSYRASVSFGSFLTGLSEADGTFQGTTALVFDNPGWQQLPMTRLDIPGMASGDGMIVRRFGDLPGEPTRFSIRKLPRPQPFSGGSLKVSMDTSSVSVSAGQRTASFRFDVVNNGSISADAVEAIVGLPTQSIIDSVSCTMAGSPCVAEATPRYVRKLADIGIGEHLVLTGTIRFNALQASNASIEASAYSTTGLVEMDMKDNVALINLADVLFSSGFDQ